MNRLASIAGFIRSLAPFRMTGIAASQDYSSLQRETSLQFILNLLLIVFVIGLPATFSRLNHPAWLIPLAFYYSTLAALVMLTMARAMNYYLRAGALIAILALAGITLLATQGLNEAGILLLFFAMILTGFLFELVTALAVFAISALAFAILGRSILNGEIYMTPVLELIGPFALGAWSLTGAILIIAGLLTVTTAWASRYNAVRILEEQKDLTRRTQEALGMVEKHNQESTAETRRRISQFEVASQIARDISAETSLEPLLQSAVNSVRDRFGFYHAGIFLNEEENEYAILRAATGEAGRQMLERKHRLKIGETGIVGYVASRGEPRIAEDVGADSVHFKNPLLPGTRSEMALPLISAGRTIGALDVQSVHENAFSQEDVRILQTVADQLAVAVVNARLVERLQTNLEELEASQRKTTRQVWQTHLRNADRKLGGRKFAYRYHHAHLDMEAPETPQSLQAAHSGQVVLQAVENHGARQDKTSTILAVPIKIRSEVLGVVDIEFESANVSPELIELIESTVNRLAVSLENARLLEEIRYRAERERLVSEITSKVRASSEVDNILRIAAQELGRSLGVSEVMVQLRPPGDGRTGPGNAGQ